MGVREGKLGAPFKSWSERCLKYRELLAVNAPLPASDVTLKKNNKKNSVILVGSWEQIVIEGSKLLMTVVPIGTVFFFLPLNVYYEWTVDII